MPPRELFYHDLLDSALAAAPEREALVFLPANREGTVRLTYRELDDVVNRTALTLLASGLGRGSRVAVYAANRPEFVFAQFACSRVGAAAVPINPLYEAGELSYLLERAGPDICLVGQGHRDSDLWANASQAAQNVPDMRLVALDPQATQAILGSDGWLRSGDLGRLSPDGFVQVTGRAKDVIIRGGENIAPAYIEDAIRDHVHDVVDVSVIGVPDDYYGEAVAAFVTLRGGASLSQTELVQRLEGKIASFRIPAHLRVIEQLPTTPSGKVQKFKLREIFAESA